MLSSVFNKEILNIFNFILAIIKHMLYNVCGGDSCDYRAKNKDGLILFRG